MMYNLSEFIKLLKQDLGLRDLPQVISDQDMVERLTQSALKEFSIRYPHRVKFALTREDRVRNLEQLIPSGNINYGLPYYDFGNRFIYKIPRAVYGQNSIINLFTVETKGPYGYADYYYPFGNALTPEMALSAISDYRLVASLQQAVTPALTWQFRHPDIIEIFNGWSDGTYIAEIGITHDASLATIPPAVFSSFRELALLDMKEYFYQTMKRVENVNVGVGEISLKIDDWSSASQDKKELLRQWDESGNLDFDYITYF